MTRKNAKELVSLIKAYVEGKQIQFFNDDKQIDLEYPNFNEEPSISGLYITEKEARFWNGSEWCNITINTVSNLSGEVNDNYVPTAKAVVNALSYLNNEMDKYATDEEVNSTVEIKVQEAIQEKLDNEDYSSLLNSINNFKNSI